MKALPTVVASLLVLSGCADYNGIYEPACMAFEGDRVELADGRFVWHRFTDQLFIGPDGNPVDPFPDYPQRGNYRADSNLLAFQTDGGDRLEPRYILELGGKLRLLTEEQNDAVRAGLDLPECVLTRRDSSN